MKEKLIIVFSMAIFNALFLTALEYEMTDNSILIYGTITTVDDESYQGQIRWGKEEAFWFDMFNSSKPKNEYLKYLSDDEIDELDEENRNGSFAGIVNWNSGYGNEDHTHSFACQFGDIASIDIKSKSKVFVNLKNGERIYLKGGSNDIGADVQIVDDEMGLIKLDWKRIDKVEFEAAPKKMKSYYGTPLYGTVDTDEGKFTGFVQWDHDERLSNDILDGEGDDGDLEIPFGKISSISKKGRNACTVTFQSGREIVLDDSNDVDSGNRGIIVSHPNFGRVDIEWDDFNSVDFTSNYKVDVDGYNDYKGERKLKGTVVSNDGATYRGEIVFDLDETYGLEILDGDINELKYLIPFNKIKTIKPLNREESLVTLMNNEELILDNRVDVNERNDGLLVFKSIRDYDYIPWEDVEIIRFDK